jgi:phosphate transport system permease protein
VSDAAAGQVTGETPEAAPLATTVPDRRDGQELQHPRLVGGVTRDGVFNLVGALSTGLCVAMLLFGRLAAFSGLIGFMVVAYVIFIVTYGVLVSLHDDRPAVVNAVMTVIMYSAALLGFMALVSVVSITLWRGRSALGHTNFFTDDMSKAGPLDPVTVGGIKHALVGTLWMISIALALTVPIGLTCAVYLNEVHGRFSRFVRTMVEAMTALPSIVAGLFIYLTWELILGFEKSGLAAALALSVMMLPIIIRASDVVLRLVPGNLREASAALGAPRWRTVWHVVIPTARPGLATAVILGTARGVGETSPVLLTAGFTSYLNVNPLHGPMVSLPLEAFKLVASGQPALVSRGFACAAFLLLVVLTLFVIARVIGGRGPGHLTRGQERRIAVASSRDEARFRARLVRDDPSRDLAEGTP